MWLLLTLACTGKEDDTGATATDDTAGGGDDTGTETTETTEDGYGLYTNKEGQVLGYGFQASCAYWGCVYDITTVGESSAITLGIAITGGDDAGHEETHDGFELASANNDGTYAYSITLGIANSADQAASNTATYGWGPNLSYLTWEVVATGSEGGTDCVVLGHDPSWYADTCTRVDE